MSWRPAFKSASMHANNSATPATTNVVKAHPPTCMHATIQCTQAHNSHMQQQLSNRLYSPSDGSHPTVATSLFLLHFSPCVQTYTLARTNAHPTHPRRNILRLDSRRCFSTVENRSRRPATPTYVQASVRPETRGKQNSLPRRSMLPDTLANCATVRGHGHSPTAAYGQSKIGHVGKPR